MRHLKQLIYGFLFLTFFSGIFGGGYYLFLRPEPSCFDGRQNQDERGLDCGGRCLKVCVPETAVLRVRGAVDILPLATASGTVRVSLLGEVENPEREFAAKNFLYTFDLFDAEGRTLASFSDTAYMYASEIRYLVLPNRVVPGGVLPHSGRLTISGIEWTPEARMPRPKIAVNVQSAADEGATFVARGIITNQDSLPFRHVELLGLFYSTEGELLGVSEAELETLAPSDQRDFAIFHPPLESLDPTRTRVFATAYNFR